MILKNGGNETFPPLAPRIAFSAYNASDGMLDCTHVFGR
jgi:hypothetical protein